MQSAIFSHYYNKTSGQTCCTLAIADCRSAPTGDYIHSVAKLANVANALVTF